MQILTSIDNDRKKQAEFRGKSLYIDKAISKSRKI